MPTNRKRLDVLLGERGLAPTREKAQALILAGSVWSAERRLEKPGMLVLADLPLEIRSRTPDFVSRAGHKLQHGLDIFGVVVKDRICLDVGASTGGFTHCLLKNGARHVFAVDVGYGQLDQALREDRRVTTIEKTNARFLTPAELGEQAAEIRLAVVDVSFISLLKILEPLAKQFPSIEDWILLFKPQFEVGREHVGKGGLVKNEQAVVDAMATLDQELQRARFGRRGGPETSPLAGKKRGNLEYLMHYVLRHDI